MTQVLKNYYQTRKTIEGFVGVDPAGIIMDMIGCAVCEKIGTKNSLVCNECKDLGNLICCYECRTIFEDDENWYYCEGCDEDFCKLCGENLKVYNCDNCDKIQCIKCSDKKYVINGDDFCVECVEPIALK